MKRVAEIDRSLTQIQKDGVTIKKHCSATDTEIRAEAERYAKHFADIEAFKIGAKFMTAQQLDKFWKTGAF